MFRKNYQKIIKVMIAVVLLCSCGQQKDENAQEQANSNEKESSLVFPYTFSDEEIIDFENKLKGTWAWFGMPDSYNNPNLYWMYIDHQKEQTFSLTPESQSTVNFDLLFSGMWLGAYVYTIEGITQTEENRYVLNVKSFENDDIWYDKDTESIEIYDINDNCTEFKAVCNSKKDAGDKSFDYFDKEYTYHKISDDFDLSENKYYEWLSDTNAELQKDDCLVCVIESGVRERKSPNGEIRTYEEQGKKKTIHVQRGCYRILDEKKDGDLTWYKIGEERWVGTKPEWIVLSNSNDNISTFNEEYREYIRNPDIEKRDKNLDYKKYAEWLQMDETEIEILKFLENIIPINNHFLSYEPYYWNSETPDTEAKYKMYNSLFFNAIMNAPGFNSFYDKKADELYKQDLKGDGIDPETHLGLEFISESVLNTYAEECLGNAIDFRTGEYSYNSILPAHIYYDAITKSYGNNEITGRGVNTSMIYINDYEEKDGLMVVNGTIFDMVESKELFYFGKEQNSDDYPYGFAIIKNSQNEPLVKDADRFDYLNNSFNKIKITLKGNNGKYQLYKIEKA